MTHSLRKKTRLRLLTLLALPAFLCAFVSCSDIQSSPTGAVSFGTSAEFAERAFALAAARSADSGADMSKESGAVNQLYLELSLQGDYSASKTTEIKNGEDAVLSFDGIPVGSQIQAVAYAYSLNSGSVRANLYKATSSRITIQRGGNILSLSLKEYDEDSDNEGKSDETLVAEAYDALAAGNYDRALAKFRAGYERNPESDSNKIYYALMELATLSTDETVTGIIREKLGVRDYPGTLNAIFNPAWTKALNEPFSPADSVLNKDWLESYPRYETLGASQFENDASGKYIRVSGKPVNSYNDGEKAIHLDWGNYILYEDSWVSYRDYRAFSGDENPYLADVRPDKNGDYLVNFYEYYYNQNPYGSANTSADEYMQEAAAEISDYLYEIKYASASCMVAEKSASGGYVRLDGTETNSYTEDSLGFSYKIDSDGSLRASWGNITSYSLSDNGAYFAEKDRYIYQRAQSLAKTALADYLYAAGNSYGKSVLGELVYLPDLAVPDWAKDYYTGTIIDATQTVKTWLYLLYANIVTSHADGFNKTLDSLIGVVSKKRETVSRLVDSLGSGTARLDASLIKNLNLTEILGEGSLYFGKTEMSILASALEALDSALNFATSYDLTANLTGAKVGFDLTHDEILAAVNECVTAKTLAVRDADKLAASKELLLSAISRLINSYDEIKVSKAYPQVAKDKISEYGDLLYDGAKKAKSALENSGIFYLPKNNETAPLPETFPDSAAKASFGMNFGKIFKEGYFTDIIKRTENKEEIRIYYKRYEESYSPDSGWSRTESKAEEITGSMEDFESSIKDAGFAYSSHGSAYQTSNIRYEVGVMADKSVITGALPGLTDFGNADSEETGCFITVFSIGD